MPLQPTLTHCFHDVSDNQFEVEDRCCFCDTPRIVMDKSRHGEFYKGLGDRIDTSGEECPKRFNPAKSKEYWNK